MRSSTPRNGQSCSAGVSASNDNKVSWYENNGASPPVWTARTISTTAASPTSVFAADVDGDGDKDVLAGCNANDTIVWYENNGASPPLWTARTISVAADATAPGAKAGNRVLKVANYDPGAAYADCHLCWTTNIAFEDGTIEFDSKAAVDPNGYGGGVAWRIKDKNNYYAVRFSAKEGNLNVFKIANGKRARC